MKKVDKEMLRVHNRQSVVSTFWRKDLVSKTEIVNYTGLCAASVSSIIMELEEEGILEETQLGSSSGGRRPMLYRIKDGIFNVACFVIDRNSIIGTICNHSGEILLSRTVMTEIKGHKQLENAFSNIVNELGKNAELLDSVKVVGISLPGIINYTQSTVTLSSPLHLENYNLQKLAESTFGRVVKVQLYKDTDALLLGEYYLGPSRNSSMAYLYIGKGVGFSLLMNDKLFFSDNCGMEVGHTIVDVGCGSKDGSAQGFLGMRLGMKHAVERYVELSACALDVSRIGYKSLEAMSHDGDDNASVVLAEQAELLGVALVNIVNIFNPKEIVIGGDLQGMDCILGRAEEYLREHSLSPFSRNAFVRDSHLTVTAGITAMAIDITSHLFFGINK